MKLWKQHTHRGRKFYRMNHGKMSKDSFFLTYYRILHTAYLKQQEYCIPVIKDMFQEALGHEPNAWSLYYMMDTESCFSDDSVIHNIHHNSRFTNMDMLQTLLVEIGFDVYLLQCFEKNKKLSRKSFYRWLPMKNSHKLKKLVKRFWKERLPKEKLFQQLFLQLQPFAFEIRTVYKKLLIENDVLFTMTPQRAVVLTEIESLLKLDDEQPENISEPTASESTSVTLCDDVPDAKPLPMPEPVPIPIVEKIVTTPVIEPIRPSEHCKKTIKVSRSSTIPDCRGFSEKKTMSKNKAVTCAVCFAAAGALLLPLVAYSVIKHK